MPLDLVKTLQELVSIPSVNPMGRPVSGPEFFEYRLTDYLQALFERLGLPWQRQSLEPKRDNIVARLDGTIPLSEGGPLIMFEAHQDTVPTDGMTIDPFDPVVRDGLLYGRGSCDIKGGMSAMLAAIARLADERPSGMPTIVMACSINEEHGYSGASDLPRLWEAGNPVLPRRPDACIVAEPTSLNVVIAHKGAVRWKISTHGRATHSSQPHLGENAIYKMARVLSALEQYQRQIVPKLAHHPLCGTPTLSVGTISGGLSVNTVPDVCTIEVDRRLVPGEDGDRAYQAVIDFVSQFPGVDFPIEHQRPFQQGSTLANGPNAELASRLTEVVRKLFGRCEQVGVPYGTDASRISAAGVPCVVFGPGCIDQAHTADEWLSIAELKQASEVLYQFGRVGLL